MLHVTSHGDSHTRYQQTRILTICTPRFRYGRKHTSRSSKERLFVAEFVKFSLGAKDFSQNCARVLSRASHRKFVSRNNLAIENLSHAYKNGNETFTTVLVCLSDLEFQTYQLSSRRTSVHERAKCSAQHRFGIECFRYDLTPREGALNTVTTASSLSRTD